MATFSRAIKEANLSIKVGTDGGRVVGGYSRGANGNYSRRGSEGGRWQRGGGSEHGRWQRGRGSRGGRWQRGRGYNRDGGGSGFSHGRGRGSSHGYSPRSRLEEDEEGDFSMDDNDSGRVNRRYSPYGGNNEGRRDSYRSPDGIGGDTEWWKVIIPQGKKHSRDWLMKRLKAICTQPFNEVDVHTFQDNLVFFVNDKSAAEALRQTSSCITTKDGSKIFVNVRPSKVPPKNPGNSVNSTNSNNVEVETSPEKLEVLKECLGNRFNVAEVKLDLSNLFVDKVLRASNMEGKIWQRKLMNTILKIINEFCPKLKILDLSDNRIQRLDILTNLNEMCPELEELILSKNDIRFTGELDKVRSHKSLSKLWLNDNPTSGQFEGDATAYRNDVRKYLPELKKLDGELLPPPIKFDLKVESAMPLTKGMYAADEQASKVVVTFLQNFMKVYDSQDVNDRQQLLPAYHNDAVFSMSCNTGIYTGVKQPPLNEYFKVSRNLKRLKENRNISSKSYLIKHKKLSVVAFLAELPQTKHQLDSFSLDIPMVTPTCLMFTVQGQFLEGKENVRRGFSRTFIVVPESNSQFLIINDQLHVRTPTDGQFEKVNKISGVQSAVSAMPNETLTAEQQELVKQFCTESKMNLKWSLQALVSNSWDYKQAAIKFGELKQGGKLPAEAFQM